MKKLLILILIIFVFNLTTVSSELLRYWTFDTDSSSSDGRFELPARFASTNIIVGNGSSDHSVTSLSNSTYGSVSEQIKVIDIWLNPDANGVNYGIIGLGNGGVDLFQINRISGNTVRGTLFTSSIERWTVNSTTSCLSGQWCHIIISLNSTDVSLYFNGTLEGQDLKGGFDIPNTLGDFHVGGQHNDGNRFDGQIDNLYFDNDSFTQLQVTDSFNVGLGFDYTPNDTIAPVVTFLPPTLTNNSINDTLPIIFNISIVEINLGDIVFSFNGTNETNTFTNVFGNIWTLTQDPMAEGNYTYSIFVNDTSGNSFQSGTFFFEIDNVLPSITFTVPDTSNTSTGTANDATNILGANINLITANLTVFNSTGGQIYQNVTSISASIFTFTDPFSLIFSGQGFATYTFSACFIDIVNQEQCEEVLLVFQSIPDEDIGDSLPLSGIVQAMAILALLVLVFAFLGKEK